MIRGLFHQFWGIKFSGFPMVPHGIHYPSTFSIWIILVGGWPTPLKNMKVSWVSWDDDILNQIWVHEPEHNWNLRTSGDDSPYPIPTTSKVIIIQTWWTYPTAQQLWCKNNTTSSNFSDAMGKVHSGNLAWQWKTSHVGWFSLPIGHSLERHYTTNAKSQERHLMDHQNHLCSQRKTTYER